MRPPASRLRTPGLIVLLSSLAIVLVVVFLLLRGGPRGIGLTVEAMPVMAGGRASFVVAAHELRREAIRPARVVRVTRTGPGAPRDLAFGQAGDAPAVVTLAEPPGDAAVAAGRADLEVAVAAGEGDATASFALPIARPGVPIGPPAASEWPVRGTCGDLEVELWSDTGVPEVGRAGTLAVLFRPPGSAAGATLAVTAAGGTQEARVEPWGGAFVPLLPRLLRSSVRVALVRDGVESCRAEAFVSATPGRLSIASVGVAPDGAGTWRARVAVTARQAAPVWGIVTARPVPAPGPLVDAQVRPVEAGTAAFDLALPGPGRYAFHALLDPSTPGAPAAAASIEAGLPPAPAPAGAVPEADRLRLAAMRQATEAAAWPPRLAPVADTVAAARDLDAARRAARDRGLLWVLGGALFAQVGWAVVLVGRGFVRRRRGGDEDDRAEAVAARSPLGDLPVVVLLAAVLVLTIAAVLWLLSGL